MGEYGPEKTRYLDNFHAVIHVPINEMYSQSYLRLIRKLNDTDSLSKYKIFFTFC